MAFHCPNTLSLDMELPPATREHPHGVECDWRPPDLATLPDWKGAKRIGIDTESKDEQIMSLGPGHFRPDCKMVGYSFAIEGGPKYYLPFDHAGGDNLPRQNCIDYLLYQLKNFDGEFVGANLPYEMGWFLNEGATWPNVKAWKDVQVADPLLYELHMNYKLDTICKRWGIPGKSEEALRAAANLLGIDPKKELWMMPARHVGEYAEDDALRPLQILRMQEAQIEAEELTAAWNMECKVLPILVKMTRRGVVVDMDRIDQMAKWVDQQEQAAWDIVKRETGITIPLGHAMDVKLLKEALLAAGLPLSVTPTQKDGLTKDHLFTLEDAEGNPHPVAQAIIAARKVNTLRNTFINGTRRHVITSPDGLSRVHCSFNQIRKTEEEGIDGEGDTKGVKYGRLSCAHPNMQNQPAADRKTGENLGGCRWRSVYKPDPDTIWTSGDLKQQEPKWSFHYAALMEKAGVEGVTGALALCEKLQENPLLDTYDPLVEVTGQKRPVCKIMWLARAYGKGDGSMCQELKLETRTVTFSKRIFNECLKAGMNKYAAKAAAVVPADSDAGEEAVRTGSFTWEGAGEEGQKIIAVFDASCPFLKVSAAIAKERADKRGFVTLLSGRRCHFEKSHNGRGYEWTHAAFNRIIQGAGAEQTKEIMIALDSAGFGDYLALQVHDEVDAFLETVKQGEEMAEVMRHAVPMLVPTVVDIERGPSWGESMFVEKIVDGKKIKEQYKWDL